MADHEQSGATLEIHNRSGRDVTTNVFGDILVATLDRDPDAEYLKHAAIRIMDTLVETHCHSLLIDLSPVELLDPFDFEGIRRMVDMAKVIGARCVLVGLRPEIVAALVDFDVDIGSLTGTATLTHGLSLLRGARKSTAAARQNPPAKTPARSAFQGKAVANPGRPTVLRRPPR